VGKIMAIQLPAITIPDNLVLTANDDSKCSEMWPDVWPANVGIFHFTQQPPEDLNIKYCEDRYKFLGDLPKEETISCPDLCPLGQYWDCNTMSCKDYENYTDYVLYTTYNNLSNSVTYNGGNGNGSLDQNIQYFLPNTEKIYSYLSYSDGSCSSPAVRNTGDSLSAPFFRIKCYGTNFYDPTVQETYYGTYTPELGTLKDFLDSCEDSIVEDTQSLESVLSQYSSEQYEYELLQVDISPKTKGKSESFNVSTFRSSSGRNCNPYKGNESFIEVANSALNLGVTSVNYTYQEVIAHKVRVYHH